MAPIAVDWVEYNARRFGDAPALQTAETRAIISWAELEPLVAGLAGALRDTYAIGFGDRVAALADNDVRFFVLQFACMRLGAIFVPLNWRLSAAELATLCTDAQPRLIVHDREWQGTAGELAEKVGMATANWGCADAERDIDTLLARATPVADEGVRTLDDPTHILYTSGSTGTPKGALVTGGTLAWHTANIAQVDEVTGLGDKLLDPLPLFHAGGLTTLAAPVLLSGGCVCVMRRFDPALTLALLSDPQLGITHYGAVPTMLQMMVDRPEFASARFDSVRHFQVAGGVASSKLLGVWAAKGVFLQTHYGGTEMGPAIAAMPKEAAAAKPGSCGFPVRHSRVRLVDDDRDVGPGEVGEVWLSGPSVTPGYWGRDHGSALRDGWFRTGDAAMRDEDGFLYLVDRLKDMYKSGGENVFPAEVERVLVEHPDINEVVVIGVPDEKWGESGVAMIVARGSALITRELLVEYCVGRLAKYKIPREVLLVETLPRNATGKIVKSELRARYLAEQAGADG
ncbi:MAG TPA: AMP-binding protein [Jatrophihabitantaceae bacterium]|nr:AMP-binding protein [Jatrophihabitantaceae bacterium]